MPGHPLSLSVGRALAAELARLAGLEGEGFPEACEEAVRNILQYARGDFQLKAELSGHDLELHLIDRGAPLQGDVRVKPGHGLERIARAVDELRWVPLGTQGKELYLRKRRPHPTLDGLEQLEVLPPEVELAPAQEYTVRRLLPEDAPGVARLTYQVYGYGYQHEEVYYPERLAAMNASGKLYSVVALDESGSVVGHYALERPDAGPVAEAGEAMVSPAHRGRKLMERMGEKLEGDAAGLGLKGIFSEAVTLHPYSQKAAEGYGRAIYGLVLNEIPGQAGRTSCVFFFQHLEPPRSREVYLPERYRELLETLYGRLNDPVVPRPGQPLQEPHGALQVELQSSYQFATIRVTHPARDSAAQVEQARHDLRELSQVEAVYLELPLSHPGTPQLVEEARGLDFRFSALMPRFSPEGDLLRLQWLAGPIEPERIVLNSPQARELLAFILAD